jgi:hypothetical protein
MQQSTNVALTFTEFQDCSRSTSCSVTVEPSDSDLAKQQQHQDYTIWGIIASVVLVLLCLIYYLCCSCRKRRRVIKKKGTQKALEINVRCSSEGNVTETRNERSEQKESAKISKQTDIVSSSPKKNGKTSKRNLQLSDDDDSFDWDSYNQTFHKRTIEKEPKKGKNSYDSGKERKLKTKASMKNRSKRRETTEHSLRKSRTVPAITEPTSNDGETIQITVIPCLKEVLDLLEEDRLKLESRHRQVLEEKMRLRADIDFSKTHIEELKHEDKRNEAELQKIEVNKELVRSGSMKCLAESETHQISLRSELTGLHTEKEEMEQLLASLKLRKRELAQKLESSIAAESPEVLGVPSEIEVPTAEEQRQIRQSHTDLVASLDEVCDGEYAYDSVFERNGGAYDYDLERDDGANNYALERDVEAQYVLEESYVEDEGYGTCYEGVPYDGEVNYLQDHDFTQGYTEGVYGESI